MVQPKRPVFVVGTAQESGRIQAAGYIAQATEGMDAGKLADLAMEIARKESCAIILLDDRAGAEFSDACTAAGAASVTPAVNKEEYAQLISSAGPSMRFKHFLNGEADAATRHYDERVAAARKEQLQKMGVYDVMDVALDLASGAADRERIPTGLKTLDEAMGGGLPMGGVTVLGATSSTGKTTLALQVADTVAESGRPVLFVTVEQGRHELAAKSISRLMRLQPTRNGGYYVASSSDIQSARAREGWGEPLRKAFYDACTTYSSRIAPNLRVMELSKQPTTKQIREAAETMRSHSGTAPCVFVDYLQLLAPAEDRMTERQAVDHNVMDLRHLARDLKTCVFVISSLNRASYSEGVTQEAFKESGAIEYGSDVLLGMQPLGMTSRLDDVPESKQKREARKIEREFKGRANREVEVRILKNRGGAVPSEAVPLDYSAVCNLFTCGTAAANPQRPKKIK